MSMAPEVCEESAKRRKSELESCEEEERTPESDSDSDSEPRGSSWEWVSKPIEYLKEKYDNDPTPQLFQCSRFVYRNKAQEKHEQDVEDAVAEYLKTARNLSPYDAINIPPLALENQHGRNWPRPIYIGGDEDLNHVINLSKIALAHYNTQNQGAKNYVLVGFLKAAWRLTPLGSHYITFQAKEDTDVDPSDCLPKTFQAHVIHRKNAKEEWTEVMDCTIKPDN